MYSECLLCHNTKIDTERFLRDYKGLLQDGKRCIEFTLTEAVQLTNNCRRNVEYSFLCYEQVDYHKT